MGDPLSVAGSVVGIISLGIQVSNGLIDYYAKFRDQNSDVVHAMTQLKNLVEMLGTVRDQLERRKFRHDEADLRKSTESCIYSCEGVIQELRLELEKFNTVAPADRSALSRMAAVGAQSGRRLLYPFRRNVLDNLEDNISELRDCISFSIQIMQQNDLEQISYTLAETEDLVHLIRAEQIERDIRVWLNAPDVSTNINEAANKRHSDTGSWFIHGETFKSWLNAPDSFLWLVGFAGCGKSVLCSTIVRSIYCHRRGNSRIGIAVFYFTFNDEGKQSNSAMLRALVLQLAEQLQGGQARLKQLFDRYKSAKPPNLALMETLRYLVQGFESTYIVLDALDESPLSTHRTEVLDTIAEVRNWSESGLHFMVSSRDEEDIRENLDLSADQIVKLRNEGIDKDIAIYVEQQLQKNRRLRRWQNHHNRIQEALTEKAQGVFRYVECQFHSLAQCGGSEDLLEALLSSLPRSLDETYERMLHNIPDLNRDYAKRILMMLCCTARPLFAEEIIEGVSVELDPRTARVNPRRRLESMEDLKRILPGFIEIDFENSPKPPTDADSDDYWPLTETVRLAHFSVHEFLSSDRLCNSSLSWFYVDLTAAHGMMAGICLTILLESGSENPGHTKHSEDGSEKKSSEDDDFGTASSGYYRGLENLFALQHYAGDHWASHLSSGHLDSTVKSALIPFLNNSYRSLEGWSEAYIDEALTLRCSWDHEAKMGTPLYFAALMELEEVVDLWLDPSSSTEFDCNNCVKQVDVNVVGGRLGTPLYAACYKGNETIARKLLDQGADLNLVGQQGTALHAAAISGSLEIIRMLLNQGANVNVPDGGYRTPLHVAAYHEDCIDMIRLLLDHGADVDCQDGSVATALQVVSDKACAADMIPLLLKHGADVNANGGKDFQTALHRAAYGKYGEEPVKLLIEHGADVNAEDYEGDTPLHMAASNESGADIVRVLIEHGANVDAVGGTFGSVLDAATLCKDNTITQILLEAGADVDNPLSDKFDRYEHLESTDHDRMQVWREAR